MDAMTTYYILIILFILLAGYFSGSEIAIISADKYKLKSATMTNAKSKSSILKLLGFLKDIDKTLSALLVGTNISIVAATSITTMLFIRKYGEQGEYYATILMTIIILIFGEILPKAIYRKQANKILIKTIYLLNFFIKLFLPIINSIIFFLKYLPGLKNLQSKQKEIFLTREDLKTIFNISAKQGILKNIDKEMFYSIFDFGLTYAREIMVPLVDIILIENNKKVSEVVKLSQKSGYSRLPVYEQHVYNIIGYINVLDLFKAKSNENISKYIRIPYYIPETKKIDDLFIEMNNKQLPIVFVVDEYGGVSGMVSQEDIVEEIIGDIDLKPQEVEKEQIKKIKTNEWETSGDVNIDDINESIDLNLTKKGFETIGGFIEYYLGKIPKKNETFIYNKYKFTMTEVTETCISKVKIKKIQKQVKD